MGNCIFTQDGEMRQRGEWKYTIPDKFGRMALAGTCKNQLSYDKKPLDKIAVVASYTGGDPSTFGYKVDGIELTDIMVVMANFYDDYSFVGKYNIPATLAYSPQGTSYGQRYADSKGLLTGCANIQPPIMIIEAMPFKMWQPTSSVEQIEIYMAILIQEMFLCTPTNIQVMLL